MSKGLYEHLSINDLTTLLVKYKDKGVFPSIVSKLKEYAEKNISIGGSSPLGQQVNLESLLNLMISQIKNNDRNKYANIDDNFIKSIVDAIRYEFTKGLGEYLDNYVNNKNNDPIIAGRMDAVYNDVRRIFYGPFSDIIRYANKKLLRLGIDLSKDEKLSKDFVSYLFGYLSVDNILNGELENIHSFINGAIYRFLYGRKEDIKKLLNISDDKEYIKLIKKVHNNTNGETKMLNKVRSDIRKSSRLISGALNSYVLEMGGIYNKIYNAILNIQTKDQVQNDFKSELLKKFNDIKSLLLKYSISVLEDLGYLDRYGRIGKGIYRIDDILREYLFNQKSQSQQNVQNQGSLNNQQQNQSSGNNP